MKSDTNGQGIASRLNKNNPFHRWIVAAASCTISESLTYPLDVTKIRLQLQNELASGRKKTVYQGMIQTASNIYQNEGAFSFFKGLPAAVLRQSISGGVAIGLYQPVRSLVCGCEDPKHATLWKRILSGALTGGIGQALATPMDVVKVRLQADGLLEVAGKSRRYKNTIDALIRIPQQEGFFGLYKGLVPSVKRACIINGCGIASYDSSKQFVILLTKKEEGLLAQTLASLCSGFISAVVSNPLDVVKTRIINQCGQNPIYNGTMDCLIRTIQSEGILALYKGFVPSYARLAPWHLSFFVVFENLNQYFFNDTI